MNQNANVIKDFFISHPYLSFFLDSPNKTGTISIFPIVSLITLIYFTLLILAKKKFNNRILQVITHVVRYMNSPITVFISLSSKLLREPIEAHYSGIQINAFLKKYWLQIIGAIFISSIFYFFSILILKLVLGIDIEDVKLLYPFNINNSSEFVFKLFKNDVYLNFSVFLLVTYLIISNSKISFLEGEYWNTKKAGLSLFIPTSEWDETPKLSLPNEELLQRSFEYEKRFLSNPHNDLIRIFLASGYDSFRNGGHLEDLLKNPRKTWKILILDPESRGARERSKQYFSDRASDRPDFTSETDYIDGTKSIISNIIRFKKDCNPNIELRMYSHNPQWRITIIGTIAIIRGFGPGQRSDRAPMLIFEHNSTSMFHTFYEMFEDVWHNYSIPYIEKDIEKGS
ncbi:MAG: hypothetical protein ACYCTV_05260 [Leptospirales bacterium]